MSGKKVSIRIGAGASFQESVVTDVQEAKVNAANAIAATNAHTLQLADKATKTDIANMGSASPKGTYATLSALQTAFPTGTTGIYLVTADGKWYYWNGSAWTIGGTYQSTGIAPKSVTPQQTTFFNVKKNLMNPSDSDVINGGYYDSTNSRITNAGFNQSGFIPVTAGNNVTSSERDTFVNWYKQDKTFLSSTTSATFTSQGYVTPPVNAYYARFLYTTANWGTAQVETGNVNTAYETYHEFEFTLVDDLAKLLQGKITVPTDGFIKGQSSKNYQVVACVLRQPSAGGGWGLVATAGHNNINVASVTNDTFKIDVTYAFTAKEIGYFGAVPDETFVQAGYSFGASVGFNVASITITPPNPQIEGYVYYDGTQWKILNQKGNLTVGSFTSGLLVLNHDSCGGTSPVSIQSHDSPYLVKLKNSATAHTDVQFTDYNGNVITTVDTNMKITLSRNSQTKYVDPNNLKSDAGNIWCFGIFEV